MNLYEYQRQGHSLTFGHSNSTFPNFFSLKTARSTEAKFHAEPPLRNKSPGHMTSMAAMPIYGKNLEKIFSGIKRPMTL